MKRRRGCEPLRGSVRRLGRGSVGWLGLEARSGAGKRSGSLGGVESGGVGCQLLLHWVSRCFKSVKDVKRVSRENLFTKISLSTDNTTIL